MHTPSGHQRERERWEKGRRAVLCWRWRLLPYDHGYICTYTSLAVSWESRGERRRDTSVIRGGSAADTEPTTPRPANSSAATPVARTHSGQARNTHTAQPPLCPPATATPSSPAAAARPPAPASTTSSQTAREPARDKGHMACPGRAACVTTYGPVRVRTA
jgi:hypothetical protein